VCASKKKRQEKLVHVQNKEEGDSRTEGRINNSKKKWSTSNGKMADLSCQQKRSTTGNGRTGGKGDQEVGHAGGFHRWGKKGRGGGRMSGVGEEAKTSNILTGPLRRSDQGGDGSGGCLISISEKKG